MNKFDKDLCAWPRCQKPRDTSRDDAELTFKDETWVLPFYCKEHGPRAVKRREATIREELNR